MRNFFSYTLFLTLLKTTPGVIALYSRNVAGAVEGYIILPWREGKTYISFTLLKTSQGCTVETTTSFVWAALLHHVPEHRVAERVTSHPSDGLLYIVFVYRDFPQRIGQPADEAAPDIVYRRVLT